MLKITLGRIVRGWPTQKYLSGAKKLIPAYIEITTVEALRVLVTRGDYTFSDLALNPCENLTDP